MVQLESEPVDRPNAGFRSVLRPLTKFVSMQVVVQVITLIVGVLVVNWLPKHEYALYSLAITVVSGIGLIANSGFSSVVLSRGAEVRHDRAVLSILIASVSSVRRPVTLVVSGLAGPMLLFLLLRNGATVVTAALITGLVVLATGASMTSAIWSELLALEYRRGALQRIAVVGSLVRLAAIGALLATPIARAALAIAINTGVVWLMRWLLTGPVERLVERGATPAHHEVVLARRSFFALLPTNTFLVFQGQIVILLLGALGQSGTLADISAVSRCAIGFAIFGSTAGLMIAPMLARSPAHLVVRRYLGVCGAIIAILTVAVSIVWTWPRAFLMILGSEYGGLTTELRIMIVGAALGCLVDVLSRLNQSRGWLSLAWLQVPTAIIAVVALVLVLDLERSRDAAILASALALPGLLVQSIQLVVGWWGLRRSLNAGEPIEA